MLQRFRTAPAALILLCSILAGAIMVGGMPGAMAQQSGANGAAAGSGPTQAKTRVTAADEAALRYYAQTRDYGRLEAEIRRLRDIDPDWQPPENLFESAAPGGGGVDETPLWNLFAQGRYADVRAEIAAMQQKDPSYQPSADLLKQLDLAEAQRRLEAAAESSQWATVLDVARQQPDLLSCARINNVWLAAEAYASTERVPLAEQLYRSLIERCDDADALVATLQKANAFLTAEQMQALFDAAEQRAQGRPDLLTRIQEARLQLEQGRFASALSGEGTVAPQTLEQLQTAARASTSPQQATDLGWYYANRKQWSQAEQWFALALQKGGGETAAEGRLVSLARSGRLDEAERFGRTVWTRYPKLQTTYIGILSEAVSRTDRAPDMATINRLAELARSSRSSNGAQVLGWAASRMGDKAAAESWFRQSLAWKPNEDAALGLALLLRERGDQAGYQQIVAEWSRRSPNFLSRLQPRGGGQAGPPGPGAMAGAALTARDYSSCLALTSRQLTSPSEYMVRGWCLLNVRRPAEAGLDFQRVMGTTRDPKEYQDSAFGYLLTMMQRGYIDEAMAQAQVLNLPPDRLRQLQAEVLGIRATKAYETGDYQTALRMLQARDLLSPTPLYLAMLRGWALYNTHQYSASKRLFQDLDRQYSTEETRGALQVFEDREGKL